MNIRKLLAASCAVMGFTTLSMAQSSEDFFEIPLAECPINIDTSGTGWYPGITFPRADIYEDTPGNKIVISYEILPGAESPKFSITTNYTKTSLPGFAGTEQDANNADRYMLPVTENGTYEYVITTETLAKLKDSSFHGWDGSIRIVGQGLMITKLAHAVNESLNEYVPETGEITWTWPGMTIPRSVFTSANEGASLEMVYELLPDVTEAQFKFTTSYGNRNMPGFPSAEYDDQEGTHTYKMTENGTFTYPITAEVKTKLSDSNFHGWDGNVHVTGSGFKVVSLKRKEYRESAGFEHPVIDAIDADKPVEFYNLQGVKVNNPTANGIYIRKQGTKTSKIIIR